MTGAIGVASPDPRKAIGLQLQADGRRVGSGLGTARAESTLLHEVLHMVSDLVRDHVGAGEVSPARRTGRRVPGRDDRSRYTLWSQGQ